jgi:hypothetical protein
MSQSNDQNNNQDNSQPWFTSSSPTYANFDINQVSRSLMIESRISMPPNQVAPDNELEVIDRENIAPQRTSQSR